ncbi:MAG: hypothetical protein ACKO23_07330 [Gemmataceae bacterium]
MLFLGISLVFWGINKGFSERKPNPISADFPRDHSGLTRNAVVVFPLQFPDGIHDGVKWHLKRWVEEVPYLILESGFLYIVKPEQVLARKDRMDPCQLALNLRAGSVLTGFVFPENDGEKLTIRAELIQSSTGFLMWTKSWTIEDVFQKNDRMDQIRLEIAQGVRKRLEGEMLNPISIRN